MPTPALIADDEPAPASDDNDLVALAMTQLADLCEKFGDGMVAAWVGLSLEGGLTSNVIRKATGANGQNGKAIRDQIKTVTTLVKNTQSSESPV
jgi:hypothetical protein